MGKIWDLYKYNDNVALLDEYGHSLTYEQIEKDSIEVVNAIGGRKLALILCENTIGSIEAYICCINSGIVPILMNSNTDISLLIKMSDAYEPNVVICPNSMLETLKSKLSLNAELIEKNGYVYLAGKQNMVPMYEGLALLLSTSGSTGSPKLVRQSYENVVSNANSIVEYLKLDSTERPITTLPMNYTYGLSIINSHLMVGATILVTDKSFMQKEFWEFFRDKRATSFGGVPYTYEMLERLRFFRMDLPYLKTMTQAGGKLTPELHERFAQYAESAGKSFVVMYGQCEATARMGYLPPERAVEKKGSMGIPIPGGKFFLIGDDGELITTPHITGELVYEGKNVTLGYAENSAELALGDERGGCLKTGDMAQFDEEGYYYIVGRKKRFLKIYGNRVNLDEIDRMIKGEFEIEVASSGEDDHMYIFITDDNLTEAVKQFVVGRTKLNPASFKVVVIDEIPKSDSGKTQYKELTKYYE